MVCDRPQCWAYRNITCRLYTCAELLLQIRYIMYCLKIPCTFYSLRLECKWQLPLLPGSLFCCSSYIARAPCATEMQYFKIYLSINLQVATPRHRSFHA